MSELITDDELRCKCGKCGGLPQPQFIAQVRELREELGFKFIVTSGYRCPVYNKLVSFTGSNGPHVQGLAVDLLISGEKALALICAAVKHGFTGIGVSQKGSISSRYIHLDAVPPGGDQPRPYIWSY